MHAGRNSKVRQVICHAPELDERSPLAMKFATTGAGVMKKTALRHYGSNSCEDTTLTSAGVGSGD
jgi:hypothetical protein